MPVAPPWRRRRPTPHRSRPPCHRRPRARTGWTGRPARSEHPPPAPAAGTGCVPDQCRGRVEHPLLGVEPGVHGGDAECGQLEVPRLGQRRHTAQVLSDHRPGDASRAPARTICQGQTVAPGAGGHQRETGHDAVVHHDVFGQGVNEVVIQLPRIAHAPILASAGRADAVDLDEMLGLAEAVLGGDLSGPRLKRLPGHLDRASATPADQVVMVDR